MEASDGDEAVEGEETDKEPDAGSDAPPLRPRSYVNLICVHCKEKCATFAVSILSSMNKRKCLRKMSYIRIT